MKTPTTASPAQPAALRSGDVVILAHGEGDVGMVLQGPVARHLEGRVPVRVTNPRMGTGRSGEHRCEASTQYLLPHTLLSVSGALRAQVSL